MLQLKNHSPFEPAITLFPDQNGIDTLYVAVKATFTITEAVEIAEEQVKPVLADEYWGDPARTSLKYASEMHLTKPTTDVVLMGHAWPPDGSPVHHLDVRVAVAERETVIRVFGNRVWRNGAITQPEPFESMPLLYEYAYGGIHIVDTETQEILAEERNPVGRGFCGKRSESELEEFPLPNLEDPKSLIGNPGDEAAPACFAFVSPAWLPRRAYAGTYDEAWQRQRAPYLPQDFDSRFFNSAHSDFVFDRYLQGGEPIELDNMSRRGPLRFTLPVCRLESKVRIAGRIETPILNLETVLIEPDEERLSMLWRTAVACDKQALKVEQVDVSLLDPQQTGKAA